MCLCSFLAQVDVREMPDKGLLILVGDRSHVVYASDSPSGMRLVIDGATCLFSKEYDPTKVCIAAGGVYLKWLTLP